MRFTPFELRFAHVVITGGARGIGEATVAAFERRGARVTFGDLDAGGEERLDVRDRASFEAFVQRCGPIDVLVNNAGVMPLGSFVDEPDAVSRLTLDVNVWGCLLGMRLVLPHMLARGRGHVVNVASMAGKIPIAGMAVYNASKFAVVGLGAAVRTELEGSGVSVSTVLPGAVRTELVTGIPLGRSVPTVSVDDVAAAIVDSCRSRRAEIAVPRGLGAWDLLYAVVPEPALAVGRRFLHARRALTSVDAQDRSAYAARIRRQSGLG